MRNLFRFLLRNYFFLMFLVLEIISLIFIISNNNYQRVKFLNSANRLCGSVYESYSSVSDYFSLKKVNEKLASENARLRNQIQQEDKIYRLFPYMNDTIVQKSFYFTTAKVINSSVNKRSNYFTLNKGSIHGIRPDMGVIGINGVVGIITNISENYSTGMTLLNKRLSIPAKIKKNNYFGSLIWDGDHFNTADLNEIPHHVQLEVGDTIITSGYSKIFPEGILIGVIEAFDIESGSNFYEIKVNLATDFKSLNYVDVIENKEKEELQKLEINNDYD